MNAEVNRYRPDDRRAVDSLYRHVFGHDAADASQLRWQWQYSRNPGNPPDGPQIWVAREGPSLIGQYATMPVRLHVGGREVTGSWGMDVMVAPERQRRGLGEQLFLTWDRNVDASLGRGRSEGSHRVFRKLHWPEVGPVPCLVKPLTRRALRIPTWPVAANRLVAAIAHPFVRLVARARPVTAQLTTVRWFDAAFDQLWTAITPKFDFAVCRRAEYLNWKYILPPHVRYTIAVLMREGAPAGYAVYRHAQEPRGRVTLLVDFLTDPDREGDLEQLLRWVDHEAREANSDKIRCFAMHAGFRRTLKHSGYFDVKSTMEFVAKINAVDVPPEFYKQTDRWHVTLGDSDQDR